MITIEVNRHKRKFPEHWSSKIPKIYKSNTIVSDLKRAIGIASVLTDGIP